MNNKVPHRFRKNLLALATCAIVAPPTALALDLASVPPGTKEPYVAPNVIISIDDSGSMKFRLNETTDTPAANGGIIAPDPLTGVWDVSAPRINILKYALKQVFSDTDLLPDKKIRLAWQSMWNNGKSPGVGSVNNILWTDGATYTSNARANNVISTGIGVNSMRPLQGGVATTGTHRKNFLDFVNGLVPLSGTPSHLMFRQADGYMRQPLSSNGPSQRTLVERTLQVTNILDVVATITSCLLMVAGMVQFLVVLRMIIQNLSFFQMEKCTEPPLLLAGPTIKFMQILMEIPLQTGLFTAGPNHCKLAV